jgi:hypothetical protein
LKNQLQGGSYTMTYRGRSFRLVSKGDSIIERENVFNFEVNGNGEVENGACEEKKEEEEGEEEEILEANDTVSLKADDSCFMPDWGIEAATTPLAPAKLPDGVSAYWDVTISTISNGVRLGSVPYKAFMDQLGFDYKPRLQVA